MSDKLQYIVRPGHLGLTTELLKWSDLNEAYVVTQRISFPLPRQVMETLEKEINEGVK